MVALCPTLLFPHDRLIGELLAHRHEMYCRRMHSSTSPRRSSPSTARGSRTAAARTMSLSRRSSACRTRAVSPERAISSSLCAKNAQAAPLLAAGGNEWLWQRAQCPLPKLGRGGTMAAWSSDAHPMPSTIPCITWSGRPSIAVMSCKARYNKESGSFSRILPSNTTSP